MTSFGFPEIGGGSRPSWLTPGLNGDRRKIGVQTLDGLTHLRGEVGCGTFGADRESGDGLIELGGDSIEKGPRRFDERPLRRVGYDFHHLPPEQLALRFAIGPEATGERLVDACELWFVALRFAAAHQRNSHVAEVIGIDGGGGDCAEFWNADLAPVAQRQHVPPLDPITFLRKHSSYTLLAAPTRPCRDYGGRALMACRFAGRTGDDRRDRTSGPIGQRRIHSGATLATTAALLRLVGGRADLPGRKSVELGV